MNKIRLLISGLVIVLVLSVSLGLVISLAAEGDLPATSDVVAGDDAVSNAIDVNEAAIEDAACAAVVAQVGAEEIDKYQTFLTQYFQMDEPSSKQILNAMEYYRFVRDAINDTYVKNQLKTDTSKPKSLDLDTAFDSVDRCIKVRDKYLGIADVMLQAHSLQSANSKRTYAIIDSMKTMNSDMREMSSIFDQVFPRTFEKMNNALPCYARQCITK